MIGQTIGQPIGYGAAFFETETPYQKFNILGYILNGDAPDCFTGNMAVKIVQGDDIVLQLRVYGIDGLEIDYGEIQYVEWELKNPLGVVVLSTNEVDAVVSDKISLYLQEVYTLQLLGNYTHEFTLYLNGNSVATVLNSSTLVPATFFIRGK